MDYQVKATAGNTFDALISIDGGDITLHSWSGKPRNSPAGTKGRNPEYNKAFNAIFDRINIPEIVVIKVLLNSKPVLNDPEIGRTLAVEEDFNTSPLQQVKNQIKERMRAYGRSDSMPEHEGNRSKKILIKTSLLEGEIVRRLRLLSVGSRDLVDVVDSRSSETVTRLPASELNKVQPTHIMSALQRLDDGDNAANFAVSRDYDVLREDGRAYAPKQVFGLALELALGIESKPGHFSAGWGTPCFKLLEKSGLWIVPKAGSDKRPPPNSADVLKAVKSLAPAEEEQTWIEGNPRIAVHLRREREPGLAAKKRAQFIRDNGKLTCEGCGFDPVVAYGEDAGTACIEVHHHRTHVADMGPSHETSLDDLRCLCANCHRVLHRSLTLGLPFRKL